MRILFLVLVAAALVGGLVLWRADRSATPGGVQPDAAAVPGLPRDPAALDAVPTTSSAAGTSAREEVQLRREVAPTPASVPAASKADAQPPAAFPDPPVEGGAVIGPVGTLAPGETAFEQKYQTFGYAERSAAVESLRAALAAAASSTDKDVQASYGAWKEELAWLEAHLEP